MNGWEAIIQKLNKEQIFYGISITVTSSNFATVIGEEYIRFLSGLGCKMFFSSNIRPFSQALKA